MLAKFWKDFSAQIGLKESVERKDVTQEQTDEMCPKCGKHHLTIRLGRRGRFIGCSGYPDCDYTRNLDGAESGEAAKRELGADPASGKPRRPGRVGRDRTMPQLYLCPPRSYLQP